MATAFEDEMLPPSMARTVRYRTFGGNGAFHNYFNDFSHIEDSNLRRRLALREIDKVPFGLYRTSMKLIRFVTGTLLYLASGKSLGSN